MMDLLYGSAGEEDHAGRHVPGTEMLTASKARAAAEWRPEVGKGKGSHDYWPREEKESKESGEVTP